MTERDDSGSILRKSEVSAGVETDYVYSYDGSGRLRTVTRGVQVVEDDPYSPVSGLRSFALNTLVTEPPGARGDETSYVYSIRGELLSAVLPDDTEIEYVYDPIGRRIGRKVDGAVEEKYLWEGLTRLLAVYDGSDAFLMRFEYGVGRMPVAMTRYDGQSQQTCFLCFDQVGSLRVVADAVGNVVKRTVCSREAGEIGAPLPRQEQCGSIPPRRTKSADLPPH